MINCNISALEVIFNEMRYIVYVLLTYLLTYMWRYIIFKEG